MFKKIDCVALYTDNIEQSIEFYKTLGLTKSWELNRQLEDISWTIVGMDFSEGGAQLVLQNDPNLKVVDVEITVEDVRSAYEQLCKNPNIHWIKTPFPIESGHVAVMEAPDKNVFVLIGK